MGIMTALAVVGAAASIGGGIMSATKKNKVPTLQAPKFETPEQAQGDYLAQGKNMDKLDAMNQDINNRDNANFRQSITNIDPNAISNIAQNGINIGKFLKGEIPDDVRQQIMRNSAQKAMSGGYGGTAMAGNLTARDLGRTSLDLMMQGGNMLQGQTAIDSAMTPGRQQISSLMMTPAQLLARDDQNKTAIANINNQNMMLQYQAALKDKGTGGILSAIGGGLMGMSGMGGGGGLGSLFGSASGLASSGSGGSSSNSIFNWGGGG